MIVNYPLYYWVLFFFIYSFIGWCIESTYVSYLQKKWVNRGFMKGPFLPIYGFGAVSMLFTALPFKENIFLTYLAGMLTATLLEYVTGEIMLFAFKTRYWDYSDKKFNIRGHVCLSTSLAWGLLCLVLVYVVHIPLERFVEHIPKNVSQIACAVLLVYGVWDFSDAFRTAFDLREVAVLYEEYKALLQNEFNEIKVKVAEEVEEERDKLTEKKKALQAKLASISSYDKVRMLRGNPTIRNTKILKMLTKFKKED